MAATGMIARMAGEATTASMAEAPSQYYDALTNLVTRLNPNTRAARREVYDRVRELLVLEAQEADPPWQLLDVVREQRALEEAIKEIEAGYEPPVERRPNRNMPRPEEWQELERALPPGARRPPPKTVEQRVPVPVRRAEPRRAPPPPPEYDDQYGYEEPQRSTALQRIRLPQMRMPTRREAIGIGAALLVLLAAWLSVASIAGWYPFGGTATREQAKPAAETSRGLPKQEAVNPALKLTPTEWVDRGNEATKTGDFDLAIDSYSNAIRGGQRTVSVYNNRAFAFWSKGETNRAIADYDEALRVDPENIVALANRAVAYNFRGDYDLAIKDLDRALKLEPKNADVWNSRCWGRALADQLKEALADCAEALRLRPNDANTYDSRGFTYLKLQQYDRAISDYDNALRINPRLAGALYGRGIAKNRKGDRGGSTDIAAAKAMKPEIEAIFSRYGVR